MIDAARIDRELPPGTAICGYCTSDVPGWELRSRDGRVLMRDDLPVAAATAAAGTAALIYDNQQAATLLIGGIVDNVVGKSLDHAWAALTSHPPVTLAAVATVGAFGVAQPLRLHRQSIS